MAEAKSTKTTIDAYDRVAENVYFKERGNFIFGWEQVVKKEEIKTELIVEMRTAADRIFINGEEYIKKIK